MKLLPKQNIEFISPLSKSELYDKLNENIEYIEKLK
jgi:DNA-dependent RNA polymerase auxiliary subunit epsilon